MATLVLSVAGGAVGGPLGSTIGAIVGQQIDQNILFRPKGREGPRLQDLAVQTSSYGSQVPRIYGTMRVAGTVIWATDLKETKSTESSGKGRPKNTVYSYSACLAVALSSRNIADIGRIWADGKIFRGSAGDFKTTTGFRFQDGNEAQIPDGLMAAAEGTDQTPSYRGLALAIFEDMDLTDYGNRIPSLTFEVIADDGSVSLADIVHDISGGRINLISNQKLVGYSASGSNRRDALEPISENFPLSFLSIGDQIAAQMRTEVANDSIAINSNELVTNIAGAAIEKAEYQTLPEARIPRQISMRYYDPSRDYQAGLQHAFRPGKGRVVSNHEFPAALEAENAKQIGLAGLLSEYRERMTGKLHVAWTSNMPRPGDQVVEIGCEMPWSVRSWELKSGALALGITRAEQVNLSIELSTDEGRAVSEIDTLAGPTIFHLVDLPFAPEAPNKAANSPQLYAVGAGNSSWRSADLFRSLPSGAIGDLINQIDAPSVIGITENALATGSYCLFDRSSSFDVSLHNAEMQLNYADDAQLSAGKNIALVGREILQFGDAEPLGNSRYRLTGLSRGLGGTEKFVSNHEAGEAFILIEPVLMTKTEPQFYDVFQSAKFFALGRGDDEPVSATIEKPGLALKPWSPVHPKFEFLTSGDLELEWTRRSREGSTWVDHVEVPIAEETEKYQIVWRDRHGNLLGETTAMAPMLAISAQDLATYLTDNIDRLDFEIRQLGQFTLSDPLYVMIEI